MSFWQKVLKILDASMEVPQPYGWFHLMWFGISILAAVALCVLYKHGKLRNVRMVVFVTAILVTVLEIYKQINFTFSYEDGIQASYSWGSLPWQFCSMPMFVDFRTYTAQRRSGTGAGMCLELRIGTGEDGCCG